MCTLLMYALFIPLALILFFGNGLPTNKEENQTTLKYKLKACVVLQGSAVALKTFSTPPKTNIKKLRCVEMNKGSK